MAVIFVLGGVGAIINPRAVMFVSSGAGPSGLQPANARRSISTRKLPWILQHGCRCIGNNGGLPVPMVIRCRSKEERKAKKTKCVLAMAKPEKADAKPLRRQYFSCRVSILEIFHSPTTLEKK
jgi:hypothetical protein